MLAKAAAKLSQRVGQQQQAVRTLIMLASLCAAAIDYADEKTMPMMMMMMAMKLKIMTPKDAFH